MDETKFFSIEETAAFFGVDESTIHGWLKRQELIATLHNRQLMIGVDAIADMIERMPERAPASVGVRRQKMQRISTSENRWRVPAKEI
jgi:hypothetical protein